MSGDHPRIVVVGGGSRYAINLCESLADYGRDLLRGSEVVLLDIRPDNLETILQFAKRLASDVGADMSFEATTDRRRAFDGADYILNTFRPGSHAEQELDERIPPTHGMVGQETVGIGGIFMCCRVAPVLQEILSDADELCPDAWIINYTNPTQHVADIVQRTSRMKIISLCDGYVQFVNDLGELLQADPSKIQIDVAGTNHAFWVMRFTIDGEDGYPLLADRVAGLTPDEVEHMRTPPRRVTLRGREFLTREMHRAGVPLDRFDFNIKLYQLYGLIPGPRYYWRYLLDQDSVLHEQRQPGYVSMAGFFIDHVVPNAFEDLDRRLKRASVELEVTRRKGGAGHGDLAVRVIGAIHANLGERFILNVTNRGAVSNLPDDAVLEVTALVDRHGAHPFALGALPEPVLGTQESLVLSQQLAVSAALSGDRNALLRAIVAHPLVSSVDVAERCMDEMLDRQRAWLPQFHGL